MIKYYIIVNALLKIYIIRIIEYVMELKRASELPNNPDYRD